MQTHPPCSEYVIWSNTLLIKFFRNALNLFAMRITFDTCHGVDPAHSHQPHSSCILCTYVHTFIYIYIYVNAYSWWRQFLPWSWLVKDMYVAPHYVVKWFDFLLSYRMPIDTQLVGQVVCSKFFWRFFCFDIRNLQNMLYWPQSSKVILYTEWKAQEDVSPSFPVWIFIISNFYFLLQPAVVGIVCKKKDRGERESFAPYHVTVVTPPPRHLGVHSLPPVR